MYSDIGANTSMRSRRSELCHELSTRHVDHMYSLENPQKDHVDHGCADRR